jgi:hypothetical protein
VDTGVGDKVIDDGCTILAVSMWAHKQRRGDLADIVAYNECDTLTTHLLMLQVARFAGQLDGDGYAREIRAVRGLLAREIGNGKAHLRLFRDRWDEWQEEKVDAALVF